MKETKKHVKFIYLSIAISIVILVVIIFAVMSAYKYYSEKPTYELEYEYVGGRDARGYVGNGKYQMWHGVYGTTLSVELDEKRRSTNVLEGEINRYTDYYGNLYYYAKDGYAVIYAENNLCKVFLTNQDAGKVEEENLIYLDSFDEFTKEEQARLKKLG